MSERRLAEKASTTVARRTTAKVLMQSAVVKVDEQV
jgi:hypothetical protein